MGPRMDRMLSLFARYAICSNQVISNPLSKLLLLAESSYKRSPIPALNQFR